MASKSNRDEKVSNNTKLKTENEKNRINGNH